MGVGTGATVGKLLGITHAMKSGVGTAGRELPGGLRVAGIAAVNAFGDVRDPHSGALVAGTRDAPGSDRLLNTARAMQEGVTRGGYTGENTTLAVAVTNARLTKVQATKLAQMAQQGFVRAISPVHTTLDGDLVIALATGEVTADLNLVGLAAADVLAEAILRAVTQAESLGGVPALADLKKGLHKA